MRKSGFKSLLVVAIAAFVLQGMVSCTSKPKQPAEQKSPEKFIGLQLWSVRDSMKNVAATIDSIGKIGYKFVETAGYGDGKIYGLDPVEFKNLCEQNGLQFLGAHTGQDVPTAEKWAETMAWWDTCIAAHKAAGAKWIVQPWMGGTGYESLDGLKKYCEYFNAVGEKCNAAGIRFGYHNHDKELSTVLEGKPIYDWMLELTDSTKVMFEMDLYWVVVGGANPVDYFNKYPGRFELWHIKDKAEIGGTGTMMNFAPIFAERAKAGAKYGIVEVEEYNFSQIESSRKSLEFLKAAEYVDFVE
jgi:sugar phosphate isomerase/epimerase